MKLLFKILLVGLGGLMLLGGGVCAATNVLTLVTGGLHSEFASLSLLLLGVCAITAGVGFFLVKVGTAGEDRPAPDQHVPDQDSPEKHDHNRDPGPGPFKP